MNIHWDRRNGMHTYPDPQRCPSCSAIVLAMEFGCDYYPCVVKCKCGKSVQTWGVIDDGRFSGLHQIWIEAGIERPIEPGEVPVNCSESVREEFESMNRTELYD